MEQKASRNDIALILFKVLSIYSFVLATDMIADNVIKVFDEKYSLLQMILRITGPAVLMVICGVIIWCTAPMLALRLAKDLSQEKNFSLSLGEMQEAAFSTIGLFILVTAIPNIIYQIAVYFRVVQHLSDVKSLLLLMAGDIYLISMATKLILGICLLIGSRRIVKIVRAIRS